MYRSKSMLWFQAMQHLQAGAPLTFGDTHLRSCARGGSTYELSLSGTITTHDHVMDALDAFAGSVGTNGMRRAVSGSRYPALFPNGSTLDWPHQPLNTWAPPDRWA